MLPAPPSCRPEAGFVSEKGVANFSYPFEMRRARPVAGRPKE